VSNIAKVLGSVLLAWSTLINATAETRSLVGEHLLLDWREHVPCPVLVILPRTAVEELG